VAREQAAGTLLLRSSAAAVSASRAPLKSPARKWTWPVAAVRVSCCGNKSPLGRDGRQVSVSDGGELIVCHLAGSIEGHAVVGTARHCVAEVIGGKPLGEDRDLTVTFAFGAAT